MYIATFNSCFCVIVIQEHFCFGEEIATEVTSFETLPVNITRSEPAWEQASVSVTLSFVDNHATFSEFMHSNSCNGTVIALQ